MHDAQVVHGYQDIHDHHQGPLFCNRDHLVSPRTCVGKLRAAFGEAGRAHKDLAEVAIQANGYQSKIRRAVPAR